MIAELHYSTSQNEINEDFLPTDNRKQPNKSNDSLDKTFIPKLQTRRVNLIFMEQCLKKDLLKILFCGVFFNCVL